MNQIILKYVVLLFFLFVIGLNIYRTNKIQVYEKVTLPVKVILMIGSLILMGMTLCFSNQWVDYGIGILAIIVLLTGSLSNGISKTQYYILSRAGRRIHFLKGYSLEKVKTFELREKDQFLEVTFVQDYHREPRKFDLKDKESIIQLIEPYGNIKFFK